MPTVRLTWEDRTAAVAQEDGYRVYRDLSPVDPESLPSPLAELPADTESYDDDTVAFGTTYYYLVEAYRGGLSRFSAVTYAVPEEPFMPEGTVLAVDFTAGLIDRSPSAHSVSLRGAATIDEDGLHGVNGSGGATVADSDDWTFSGDFTIEWWGVETGSGANYHMVSQYQTTGGQRSFLLGVTLAGFVCYLSNTGVLEGDSKIVESDTLDDDLIAAGASHVAFCRKGTTAYVFINGVLVGEAEFPGALHNSIADLVVGAHPGLCTSVRIVSGLALYIADFTPPADIYEEVEPPDAVALFLARAEAMTGALEYWCTLTPSTDIETGDDSGTERAVAWSGRKGVSDGEATLTEGPSYIASDVYLGGRPSLYFDKTDDCYMTLSSTLTGVRYFLAIMAYKTGVEIADPGSQGNDEFLRDESNRLCVLANNTGDLNQTFLIRQVRINGGAVTTTLLPLPCSFCEFEAFDSSTFSIKFLPTENATNRVLQVRLGFMMALDQVPEVDELEELLNLGADVFSYEVAE